MTKPKTANAKYEGVPDIYRSKATILPKIRNTYLPRPIIQAPISILVTPYRFLCNPQLFYLCC